MAARRRSLARPLIHLGIPVKPPLWARGLKSYVEYPPSYCDGVLYVNTFEGDTWAIKAKTGKVIWRRRNTATEAVDARDQRRAPDREREGRHGQRPQPAERQARLAAAHASPKVESSPAIVKRRRLLRRRPTVACSRSMPRPARSAGSTTRAAGSTRAPRSPTGACASPPTPARSCACAATDGERALEHVRQARRVPLRELLRERLDRRSRASTRSGRSGNDRRARRAQRADRVDGTHLASWATRRPRSATTASSSAASTGPCTRTGRPMARQLWRTPRRRRGSSGAAAPRRQARLLLDPRTEDLRGPDSTPARSSGGYPHRQVLARASRPSARTTSP